MKIPFTLGRCTSFSTKSVIISYCVTLYLPRIGTPLIDGGILCNMKSELYENISEGRIRSKAPKKGKQIKREDDKGIFDGPLSIRRYGVERINIVTRLQLHTQVR